LFLIIELMAWMSPKHSETSPAYSLSTWYLFISWFMICLDAPTFGSISNRGKQHFLKRDRGAWRAAICLDSTWPASCRFSLGIDPRTCMFEPLIKL
jgi:hypothetical protein